MVTTSEIHWLAGILEGEGSFTYSGLTPMVQLQMVDRDVVERAARIMGTTVGHRRRPTITGKTAYFTQASGGRSVGIMQTVYPLMSSRRQAAIRQRISDWKPAKRIAPELVARVRRDAESGIPLKRIASSTGLGYVHVWKIARRKVWASVA